MRILLLIGMITWHVASSQDPMVQRYRSAFDPVINSLNIYSNEFFKIIVDNQNGNRVCSPIGASMIMSQASLGATGKTRRELNRALPLPTNNNDALNVNRDLAKSFVSFFKYKRDVELFVANQMFVGEGVTLKREFLEAMWSTFDDYPTTIDLTDSVSTRKAINNWASYRTKNHMNDAFRGGEIHNIADLVLVSAAYFRGDWALPFDPEQTKMMQFWADGQRPVSVPTMVNFGVYRCGHLGQVDSKFIQIPYKSESGTNGLSMYIILPNKRNGIGRLLSDLEKVSVDELQRGEKYYVNVQIPKFKIETTVDLRNPFRQLGVTEMFERIPDFKGITGDDSIKLVQAIQKVTIEVDEGGTTAGATTGLIDSVFNQSPVKFERNVELKVDHPFVAMIVNEKGLILFNAIVTSPKGSRIHHPLPMPGPPYIALPGLSNGFQTW